MVDSHCELHLNSSSINTVKHRKPSGDPSVSYKAAGSEWISSVGSFWHLSLISGVVCGFTRTVGTETESVVNAVTEAIS